MQFEFFGPFQIPINRDSGLIIRTSAELRLFWDDVVESPRQRGAEGLSHACGCYLYGLRAGGGIRIHYVGQANKQSFRKEALHPTKQVLYNEAYMSQDAGSPVLFLIARMTPGARSFSAPTTARKGYREIDFLEDYLMAAALARNPGLLNRQGLAMLRNIQLPGILNHQGGNPGRAATLVKKALRL